MFLNIAKTIWGKVINNHHLYLLTDSAKLADGYAVRENKYSRGCTVYGFFDERTIVYDLKDVY